MIVTTNASRISNSESGNKSGKMQSESRQLTQTDYDMQHPMYPIFVGIIKPNNFIFDFPAIVFFVSIIYIDHFFLSRLMPKMKDLSIATTNAPFFPSLCLFLRENSDEIVMAFLKFNLHVFKTDQQNLRIFFLNKNSYRSFYTFVIYIHLQK